MKLHFLLIALLLVPIIPAHVEGEKVAGVPIGICWVTPPFYDAALQRMAYEKAAELGCEIVHIQIDWDEIEKGNGTYDWNAVDDFVKWTSENGIAQSFVLGVINSCSPDLGLPSDLKGKRIDDEAVLQRLENFTLKFFERHPGIKYFAFGNEVNYVFRVYDVYDQFVNLSSRMRAFVHARLPDVKVIGVFGFSGMTAKEWEQAPKIMEHCDVLGISSYELGNIKVNYEALDAHFDKCANVTDKPVAIVETAGFSSQAVNGSPEYQAEYVRFFFHYIREHSSRLLFACWFSLYDMPPGFATGLAPFLESFNSCGLLTTDGRTKMAYYVWLEEIGYEPSGKGSNAGMRALAMCATCATVGAIFAGAHFGNRTKRK